MPTRGLASWLATNCDVVSLSVPLIKSKSFPFGVSYLEAWLYFKAAGMAFVLKSTKKGVALNINKDTQVDNAAKNRAKKIETIATVNGQSLMTLVVVATFVVRARMMK